MFFSQFQGQKQVNNFKMFLKIRFYKVYKYAVIIFCNLCVLGLSALFWEVIKKFNQYFFLNRDFSSNFFLTITSSVV